MTTAELLAALARERPNGVSFEPMAVRLLRQKVPLKDWQIEALKAAMFQIRNGLWFSREMIGNDESRLDVESQAMAWLNEYGCFSIERLFGNFRKLLNPISTPEDCAAFLQHLGFNVTVWGQGNHRFCFLPPSSLHDILAAVSETISGWLEEADGTLTFLEIEHGMPNLTAEALESIRLQFLPEVLEAEIGRVPCWRIADLISLPEDFSEKLTTAVDTLIALKERVSAATLEFALNLFYRTRFREEYGLVDNEIFVGVCSKHYQGGNDAFPNRNKPRAKTNNGSAAGKRVRSPNSTFQNLQLPIGTELVFKHDSHVICTVLDKINQVEYEGRAWTVSSLAKKLLRVSSTNGFRHFIYEGETLLQRRLRLGNEKKSRVK